MKSLVAIIFAFAFISTSFAKDPAPQKWSGFLIDQQCQTHIQSKKLSPEKTQAKIEAHTKECALMEDCVASGYGIWSEGKYYTFDAAGNKQVGAMLAKSKKTDHIGITVSGVMKGKSIAVSSVVEK